MVSIFEKYGKRIAWLGSILTSALMFSNLCYLFFLDTGATLEFSNRFQYYYVTYQIVFSTMYFLAYAGYFLSLKYFLSFKDLPFVQDMIGNLSTLLLLPFVYNASLVMSDSGRVMILALVFLFFLHKAYLAISTSAISCKPNAKIHAYMIIACILLALFTRLLFLLSAYHDINSDEAITGLMARHILFGQDFPVFFYGQARSGSLEALLSIPLFFLFGASVLSLKLTPLVFSIMLLVTTYIFSRVVFGQIVGLIAAFLVALPSAFLSVYSILPITYIETAFFGILLSLLAFKLAQAPHNRIIAAILGLSTGLAVWNNFMIFPWLLVVATFVFNECRKSRSFESPAIISVSALMGAFPVVYYNIQHPGISIAEYFGGNRYGSFAEMSIGLRKVFMLVFSKFIPNAIGIDFAYSLNPFAGHLAIAVVYGVIAYSGYSLLKTQQNLERKGLAFLLAILALTSISYLFSKGTASVAARYSITFIPIVIILLAFTISKVYERHKFSAAILLLCLSALSIGSHVREFRNPSIAELGIPGQTLQKMTDFLNQHGIDHVFSDYWIAYQFDYVSKEKIINAPWPGFDRYPAYTNMINQAPPNKLAYIYEKGSASEAFFMKRAALFKVKPKVESIADYVIFYGIEKRIY